MPLHAEDERRIDERTAVFYVQIHNNPYTHLYTVGDFYNKRFMHFADTHNSAVIQGSTFSSKDSDYTSGVLDASSIAYITDEHGVRIGITMATADGRLGRSVDARENDSTALVAREACEQYVAQTVTALGTFRDHTEPTMPGELTRSYAVHLEGIGQQSKMAALDAGYGTGETFDSKSSLSTTTIVSTDDGIRCYLGNIGDGMVLVVDHATLQVKGMLCPRVYARGTPGEGEQWHPASLQDLTRLNQHQVDFVSPENIQEDDIIIQMTDGIWGEFPSQTEVVKGDVEGGKWKYKATSVDVAGIDRVLASVLTDHSEGVPAEAISAHQIADALVRPALRLTLAMRMKFTTLEKNLAPYIKKLPKDDAGKRNYMLGEWMEDIRNGNAERGMKANPALADALYHYLEASAHDGAKYKPETCSADFFAIQLQQAKTFGDCATISVMRVPNQLVERLRPLFENPQHFRKLLPGIIEYAKARYPSDYSGRIGVAMTRLKEERFLTQKPMSKDQIAQEGRRFSEMEDSYKLSYNPVIVERLLGLPLVYSLLKDPSGNDRPKQDRLDDLYLTLHAQTSFAQMDTIFEAARWVKEFNEHRRSQWDSLLMLDNTRSWRETWGKMKQCAKDKLFEEVDNTELTTDKIKMLNEAEKLPIFCKHKNNSFFSGAFGRTQSVKDIQAKRTDIVTRTSIGV